MRDSDEEIAADLKGKGIEHVGFYDYEIDGRNMHYIHIGEEGKPLIIFIHGTPGSCSMYNGYMSDSTLLTAAQLVAVDRMGLGYSDFGHAERSLEMQAAAIKPIIDRHPTERVVILGHSYGGPVVARLAMDYPDLIDGMVIVAGSISPELEPREWWRGPLDWWIFRWILPPSLKVANQEIMALYEELNLMLPMWPHISCNSAVYQGTADNLVAPGNAAFADSMLLNAPQKDITYIPDGDHFILWSEMDKIVETLGRMLQDSTQAERLADPAN